MFGYNVKSIYKLKIAKNVNKWVVYKNGKNKNKNNILIFIKEILQLKIRKKEIY